MRVNSIHPGFIWTPMVEKHLQSLGDVAAVTGAELVIDGGYTAR